MSPAQRKLVVRSALRANCLCATIRVAARVDQLYVMQKCVTIMWLIALCFLSYFTTFTATHDIMNCFMMWQRTGFFWAHSDMAPLMGVILWALACLAVYLFKPWGEGPVSMKLQQQLLFALFPVVATMKKRYGDDMKDWTLKDILFSVGELQAMERMGMLQKVNARPKNKALTLGTSFEDGDKSPVAVEGTIVDVDRALEVQAEADNL